MVNHKEDRSRTDVIFFIDQHPSKEQREKKRTNGFGLKMQKTHHIPLNVFGAYGA
jgi:hypothetical protein